MLRLATFNCENLFSRATLLNFEAGSATSELLSQLASLAAILEKDHYSLADKQEIIRLVDSLSDFIEINTLRGSLLRTGDNGETQVGPSGRSKWVGGIELKRSSVPLAAQKNTLKILDFCAADVQFVVEVENRRTLEDFNGKLSNPFPFHMLVDGNDDRGIDVGILSRFEIAAVRSHIFDRGEGGTVKGNRIFSRDCLEVDLKLPGDRLLHVFVNHLKSQRSGSPQETDEADALRLVQAKRLVAIIKERNLDLTRDLVVVGGDLNNSPDSPSLRPLLSLEGLTDVLEGRPDRWTYHHSGFGNSQLDYLLVSEPLRAKMKGTHIERRGIYDVQATDEEGQPIPSLPGLTKLLQASDHGAVIASFEI